MKTSDLKAAIENEGFELDFVDGTWSFQGYEIGIEWMNRNGEAFMPRFYRSGQDPVDLKNIDQVVALLNGKNIRPKRTRKAKTKSVASKRTEKLEDALDQNQDPVLEEQSATAAPKRGRGRPADGSAPKSKLSVTVDTALLRTAVDLFAKEHKTVSNLMETALKFYVQSRQALPA